MSKLNSFSQKSSQDQPPIYCPNCGNEDLWVLTFELFFTYKDGELRLDKSEISGILKDLFDDESTIIDFVRFPDENTKIRCQRCGGIPRVRQDVQDECLLDNCPGCLHCGRVSSREEILEICGECTNLYWEKEQVTPCVICKYNHSRRVHGITNKAAIINYQNKNKAISFVDIESFDSALNDENSHREKKEL